MTTIKIYKKIVLDQRILELSGSKRRKEPTGKHMMLAGGERRGGEPAGVVMVMSLLIPAMEAAGSSSRERVRAGERRGHLHAR